MTDRPERIFTTEDGGEWGGENKWSCGSDPYCEDEVEYVRADVFEAALARVEASRDAAPWMPPEDKPEAFECLGWCDGEWLHIVWLPPVWRWVSEDGEVIRPTAFAPLPPPPQAEITDALRRVPVGEINMKPNYSDGKWHLWTGGKCPIDPAEMVDMIWPWEGECYREIRKAHEFDWVVCDETEPFMFRVVEQPE